MVTPSPLSKMHFAYPPRKSSNPPPFLPRASRLPTFGRNRLKLIALGGLAFIIILYLFNRGGTRHGYPTPRPPSGNPPVVILTVMDETKYPKQYLDIVKENRVAYAEKHGTEECLVQHPIPLSPCAGIY